MSEHVDIAKKRDPGSPLVAPNTDEIAHGAGVHRAFSEAAGRGAPLPSDAPQSGKRILLSIFLYMILLPAAIMILAQQLVG
jgi:hypothetical protein